VRVGEVQGTLGRYFKEIDEQQIAGDGAAAAPAA